MLKKARVTNVFPLCGCWVGLVHGLYLTVSCGCTPPSALHQQLRGFPCGKTGIVSRDMRYEYLSQIARGWRSMRSGIGVALMR